MMDVSVDRKSYYDFCEGLLLDAFLTPREAAEVIAMVHERLKRFDCWEDDYRSRDLSVVWVLRNHIMKAAIAYTRKNIPGFQFEPCFRIASPLNIKEYNL